MIIFGTRNRTKKTSEGTFYCPKCRATRTYEYKKVARYFALYFIPLIPIQQLGEYVECSVCKTTFKPDVLKLAAPK